MRNSERKKEGRRRRHSIWNSFALGFGISDLGLGADNIVPEKKTNGIRNRVRGMGNVKDWRKA